jgi:hypothetical protein
MAVDLPINYNRAHWAERKAARNEYIRLQNGLCYYCNESLSGNPSEQIASKKVTRRLFPENFFKWPVHLHHNHNTGMTIGAVHCHCNAVLWEYDGE